MFKIYNLYRKIIQKKSTNSFENLNVLQNKPSKVNGSNRKRNFRNNNLFSYLSKLIVIMVLLGATYFYIKNNYFKVAKIDCKTQYSLCSEQDQNTLSELVGKSMIDVNSKSVEDKIIKNYSNRRIVTQKIFPSTLSVFIEKRKPLVALDPTIGEEGLYLVDNDGVIQQFVNSSSLPVVVLTPNSPLMLGGKADSDIQQAVKLMHLIYKGQNINKGSMNGKSLEILLSNDIKVIFSLDRDPQVLVGALQLITSRIRIEGKVPKSIDLRYSNPVLTY